MLLSTNQLEESEKRFTTSEETPDSEITSNHEKYSNRTEVPGEATKGPIISAGENLIKRKAMLKALEKEPVDFALERAIGENDSVYSNFVELIKSAKQKVGRIAIKKGNRAKGFATGFMVSDSLLLTNWHVFEKIEDVADSEIQFFYEYDLQGNKETAISFKLQSGAFYHSNKELDYCLVAVSPMDISGTKSLAGIGYLYLNPALGKVGSAKKEALNIIHHPDGDYMQLSIRENIFVKITPTSIWYETDTAPGSSGSPVFNDQWQVVALHHMGIGRKNIMNQYIDKYGDIIHEVNGKIDASRIVWEANEGIRISVILKDLFLVLGDNPMLAGLKVEPLDRINSKSVKTIAESALPKPIPLSDKHITNDTPTDLVNISFPASLVEKNSSITVTINHADATKQDSNTLVASTDDELGLAEIKKLEEVTDFGLCKGYQSRFLGRTLNIPLPQPIKAIKKFIAKVGNTNSIVLKYYNYSAIFHSLRRMPLISAINVDGDAEKRKDATARKDIWLRDTRLSLDVQLDDAYYRNSGFDKGHMSRREDANWGSTAEEAKRNADFTCMYTNACPQVARINQSSRKGLWGNLEKIVLENGAVAEKGKTAKISVFNGPLFKDTDPVFKGIQVPMDFYKIVLWLTDSGDLKATAFKLSQDKLVENIDFEQIGVDQNADFKEYQCSIKSLQKETGIDFSAISPFDTFKGREAEEVVLNSEWEIANHILNNNR